MQRGSGVDPFEEIKRSSEEYKIYDSHYERIGKVDDLIADDDDRVLYLGVKMGFFGTSSTLVPAEIVRVNDRRRLVEVSESAETIKHAPRFAESEELTLELENHVRAYFGLEDLRPLPEHELRGSYPTDASPADQVDLAPEEQAASQDRSAPVSDRGPEERPAERRPEAGADEQGSISERLSDGSGGFWERLTGGGVTVHRLRR